MGAQAIAGLSPAQMDANPLLLYQKPDSVNHNVWSNDTAQMLSGLHLVLTLGHILAVTLSATRPPLAHAGSHGLLI